MEKEQRGKKEKRKRVGGEKRKGEMFLHLQMTVLFYFWVPVHHPTMLELKSVCAILRVEVGKMGRPGKEHHLLILLKKKSLFQALERQDFKRMKGLPQTYPNPWRSLKIEEN